MHPLSQASAIYKCPVLLHLLTTVSIYNAH